MKQFQKTDERFEKNLGIFSPEDLKKIINTKVLIVGLGGLGGYLANSLCRLGVRHITIVDSDSFVNSNLNRQLFSTIEAIGKKKVDVVAHELYKIYPEIHLEKYAAAIEQIDCEIFRNIDVVFDAVDVIRTKLFLEEMCHEYERPLIHGALGGWFGQVGISMPKSNLLKDFYDRAISGLEKNMGAPTFIPPLVASYMVVQFVLLCLERKEALVNQILNIDAFNNDLSLVYKKDRGNNG